MKEQILHFPEKLTYQSKQECRKQQTNNFQDNFRTKLKKVAKHLEESGFEVIWSWLIYISHHLSAKEGSVKIPMEWPALFIAAPFPADSFFWAVPILQPPTAHTAIAVKSSTIM